MVYGGHQANLIKDFGASAGSASSMPEMLQSEAFASAVRQKPTAEDAEDIDLSRMEVPELSPVIKEVNPNVEAQIYAVVDNRFLESSRVEEL